MNFVFNLSIPTFALNPEDYSDFNRNDYQKQTTFLGSKARQVRKFDKFTAICEPIVYTMWDPQHLTIL
jgi:hypothetical protein